MNTQGCKSLLLFFVAWAMVSDSEQARAASPQLRCRTVEQKAPVGFDNSSLRHLSCPDDSFLLAAKQTLQDGSALCAISIYQDPASGVSKVDAGCGALPAPYQWVSQLTCCKSEERPNLMVDCKQLRAKGRMGGPSGSELEKVSCPAEHGTLVSAQSYYLPSGRGNCPVRWHTEDDDIQVSAGFCPAPPPDNYWAIDYICCKVRAPSRKGTM